jgi:two-component system OmpR family response regulator
VIFEEVENMISNICREMDRLGEVVVPADEFCEPPTQCSLQSSRKECGVGSSVESRETLLRVGSLELDLIDRTAKRGNRQIDLRPREFQLPRYMMRRSDRLLTRAEFFNDVCGYHFVPQTNLIDVHMGRLRRKVDGPDDAPMIRSVRGKGFVLSAIPELRAQAVRAHSNEF